MGAVSTVGQLDVAEADTVGAIVDEDIVGFDIYDHESRPFPLKIPSVRFYIPVWTIPSACSAASASKTAFATRFTSEDSSVAEPDSSRRLLSRCSRTSRGGSATALKYVRTSRSLQRR